MTTTTVRLDPTSGTFSPGRCGCRAAYGDGSVCELEVSQPSDVDAIAYVPFETRATLLEGFSLPNTKHVFVHRNHVEQVLTDIPLWVVRAARPVVNDNG